MSYNYRLTVGDKAYDLPNDITFGLNQSANFVQNKITKNLSIRKFSTNIPSDLFTTIYNSIVIENNLNSNTKISFDLIEGENIISLISDEILYTLDYQYSLTDDRGPGSTTSSVNVSTDEAGIYLTLNFNFTGE